MSGIIRIEIETDSAAFADGAESRELCRILRHLANRVRYGELPPQLWDSDGQPVGTVERIVNHDPMCDMEAGCDC